MSRYQIGVVTGRVSMAAVALKDGEYLDHYILDIDPHGGKTTWDRNYQLHAMVNGLLDLVDQIEDKDPLAAPSIAVEAAMPTNNVRNMIERSQTVGAILSLPYIVHEVSRRTWQKSLDFDWSDVGVAVERAGLPKEVKDSVECRDAFLVARYGYKRGLQQDSRSAVV